MSILKRSVYSYVLNIISLIFTFISGLYIANSLGPTDYGTYAYLVAFFSGVFYMLDLGSSSAFFTFIAKNNKNLNFFLNYFYFLFFIISIVFVLFLCAPKTILDFLSFESSKTLLLISIPAIFLRSIVWNIVKKIYESQRLSIVINFINAFAAIFYCIVILVVDKLFELNVTLIFKIITVEFACLFVITFIIKPIKISSDKNDTSLLSKYYRYCLPIAPSIIFLGIVKMFEPWIIVTFGGIEQQAFYSISLQFSMLMVVVLSSVINIFWKEIAENIENQNIIEAGKLYYEFSKYLYLFMNFCAVFLFFQAENIINLFLGKEYIMATVTMKLLFLYPCMQVFGQLNGVVFLSLEDTHSYSKFQIYQGLLSIFISYLGVYILTNYLNSSLSVASFMAIKTLLIAIIFMFVMTNIVRKKLIINDKFKFIMTIPITFFMINFITHEFVEFSLDSLNLDLYLFVEICSYAIIFIIFSILLFIKFPYIFSISKDDSIILNKKLKSQLNLMGNK